MSAHSELLRELIERFNRRQPIEVERYFAPTLRLIQPVGANRSGLEGAQAMVDALYALGDDVRLIILELIEHGDMVAVRWQVEGMKGDASAAMIGMYRFEAGRIVRDWGIAVAEAWPPE
jgi:predicted SnoaL-like aldol condensation-catalyzing enzyme